MQDNGIAGLLSDSNLIEKLKSALESKTSSETNLETNTASNNQMYKEYIDIILALKPFIPERNRHKAEMLIKLFDCASALQEIRQGII